MTRKVGILSLAGLWIGLSLGLSGPALSQTTVVGPEDNTGTTTIDLSETGDFELEGKIEIRELRFDKVGEVGVRFPGNQPRRQIDKSGRINLPAKIQPGVTYRNVTVTFQLLSDLLVEQIKPVAGPVTGTATEPDQAP